MSSPDDKLRDLGAVAGVFLGEGDHAPIVRITEDVNAMAKLLGQVVPRLDLFEMNGELVFFDHRGERKEMTARVFRTWIADHVVLALSFDKDSGDVKKVGSLHITDSGTVLDSPNFLRGVRRIVGVNRERLPVLRENGKLELLPWGHDDQVHAYTTPGGLKYDEEMDIASAKAWLEKHFSSFPFQDGRSLAVQIAAMLALYVKHLPGGGGLRPGLLWMANEVGSGKSVLAKAALYPVMGTAASAKMKKGEELDKELEAFSRAAAPYIFIDNVYGELKSMAIDGLLTSEESTGRSMGGHGTFIAKNTALLLITGNQLDLNDDAKRRFLIVDLFEKGDSTKREIPFPLTDTVMKAPEWRARTLAALWALVRNWADTVDVDGNRHQGGHVLRSFEEYSRLMGGIVMAAGYGDPFEPVEIKDGSGPQRQDFEDLMAAVLEDMQLSDDTKHEKTYTLEGICVLARSKELWVDKIGNVDQGKKLTIKEEGLGKDERAFAEDRGYLTSSQRSALALILKPKAEKIFAVGGKRMEFGKREGSRKAKFTVRVLH